MKKKQIAILGSTGSIGTQALKVIEEHPDLYEAYALTANNQVELLAEQARKFMPAAVVIANEAKYLQLKEMLADLPIQVYAGADALCEIVEAKPIDVVLASMVGYAGLRPTMNAIRAGKAIALANKETLVVAGELINALAQQYKTPILPVDSEHSAIFQCLEPNNALEKVILTASGGPFRKFTMEQLQHVTKEQALKHPNWDVLARHAVAACCALRKDAVFISERDRKSVYLGLDRPDKVGNCLLCALDKGSELIVGKDVGERVHPGGVCDLSELVKRLAADALRGAVGTEKFGIFLLKTLELGKHHVVFVVGYYGGIVNVIQLCVVSQLTAQFFYFFLDHFVLSPAFLIGK